MSRKTFISELFSHRALLSEQGEAFSDSWASVTANRLRVGFHLGAAPTHSDCGSRARPAFLTVLRRSRGLSQKNFGFSRRLRANRLDAF